MRVPIVVNIITKSHGLVNKNVLLLQRTYFSQNNVNAEINTGLAYGIEARLKASKVESRKFNILLKNRYLQSRCSTLRLQL